jgi:hypothetical protein
VTGLDGVVAEARGGETATNGLGCGGRSSCIDVGADTATGSGS